MSNAQPAPAYMVDNRKNYYKVAPDKGKQNGPLWTYSGSLDGYLSNLNRGFVLRGGYESSNNRSRNATRQTPFVQGAPKWQAEAAGPSYWFSELSSLGSVRFSFHSFATKFHYSLELILIRSIYSNRSLAVPTTNSSAMLSQTLELITRETQTQQRLSMPRPPAGTNSRSVASRHDVAKTAEIPLPREPYSSSQAAHTKSARP